MESGAPVESIVPTAESGLETKIKGFKEGLKAVTESRASESLGNLVKASNPEKYLPGTFIERETVSDLKFESKAVSVSDELIDVLSSCIDSLPVTADSAEKLADFYKFVNMGARNADSLIDRPQGLLTGKIQKGQKVAELITAEDGILPVEGKDEKMGAFRKGLFLGALVLDRPKDALEALTPEELPTVFPIVSLFRQHLSASPEEIRESGKAERREPLVSAQAIDAEMAKRGYLWQENSYKQQEIK